MNSEWINHLSQWECFLRKRLEQIGDLDYGEKVKISRQLQVINDVKFAAILSPELLLDFINGPLNKEKTTDIQLDYQLELNDSQKEAVKNCISDSPLSLVQGPPGTGKTQVITEICLQLYSINPNIRILICSETHVAVNNILERILSANPSIKCVRIADKTQQLESFCAEAIIKNYTDFIVSTDLDKNLKTIILESFSDIYDKGLEKALILSSNVAGLTCNRVGRYNFIDSNEMIDVVIIDEACKATLPELLLPLSIAKKAILVGDPKQLPPVFCSEERDIINAIESCDLMNHMHIDWLFTSESTNFLDTQYRMVNPIGDFISSTFYDGTLKNGKTNSSAECMFWIDYKPTHKWPDSQNEIYNLDEIRIIGNLLGDLNSSTEDKISVSVISPYREQISRFRNTLQVNKYSKLNIQIDSVDAFQGKESDIVIFSLTRTHGSYRFLADKRRLNVALSRAKEKIYIVGDAQYAKNNELLTQVLSKCTKT